MTQHATTLHDTAWDMHHLLWSDIANVHNAHGLTMFSQQTLCV